MREWVGRPFGCRVTSRNRGQHLHLLGLTPELWTLVVRQRTQILYLADAALICAKLELRPGARVLESGTGTGSLSTTLARAVGKRGEVRTFEFHAQRAEMAQKDFDANGLGGIITCVQRDIEAKGFPVDEVDANAEEKGKGGDERRTGKETGEETGEKVEDEKRNETNAIDESTATPATPKLPETTKPTDETKNEGASSTQNEPASSTKNEPASSPNGGSSFSTIDPSFTFAPSSFDAAILDLPNPWRALPSVARLLRPDGRVAVFSPCIEQIQRSAAALARQGFHDAQCFELLLRGYDIQPDRLGKGVGGGWGTDPAVANDGSVQWTKPIGKKRAAELAGKGDGMRGNGKRGRSDDTQREKTEGSEQADADNNRGNGGNESAQVPDTTAPAAASTATASDDVSAPEPALLPFGPHVRARAVDLCFARPGVVARALDLGRGHTGYLMFARKGVWAPGAETDDTDKEPEDGEEQGAENRKEQAEESGDKDGEKDL